MTDTLHAALRIAGAGLDSQALRLRVASENLANARTTGPDAGSDPFSRKTITFDSVFDRALGAHLVKLRAIGVDQRPFKVEYEPGHPAADASGAVKYPNIDPLIELADIREANRVYEANIQVVRQTRSLMTMMVDLLRTSG